MVTGNTAIAVKRGTLNVTGGVIHATGARNYDVGANNNGTEMTGAAISVTETYNVYGPLSVTVSGGTVTSDNADAIFKKTATYENGATIAVSGGLFSSQIADEHCATGYIPTIAPVDHGYYTVKEGGYVAQIGDVKYATLHEAFIFAQDGDTIDLLKSTSLTERIYVNAGSTPVLDAGNRYATTSDDRSLTLNLNGYRITSDSNIALAGGSLTITNSASAVNSIKTTASGLAPIEVRGTGDLDKKRTLVVAKGVTIDGGDYGLNIFSSNDAKENVIDVTVDGTVNGTVFVLGNLVNTANKINITVNGTVAGDEDDVSIALNGFANVTVNEGATVSGVSGIEVRAGSLKVLGGTVNGTGTPAGLTPNGDGTTSKGAAVAVAQHTTKLPATVNISGGTFTGYTAFYEGNPQNKANDVISKLALYVSGGTFTGTTVRRFTALTPRAARYSALWRAAISRQRFPKCTARSALSLTTRRHLRTTRSRWWKMPP